MKCGPLPLQERAGKHMDDNLASHALALSISHLVLEIVEKDPFEALTLATGAWRDVCATSRAFAQDAVLTALGALKLNTSFIRKFAVAVQATDDQAEEAAVEDATTWWESDAAIVRVGAKRLALCLKRDLASPRLTPPMRDMVRDVGGWHPMRLHLLADMCEQHGLEWLGFVVGERGGSVESLRAYEETEEHRILIHSAMAVVGSRFLDFPPERLHDASLGELLGMQRISINHTPWVTVLPGFKPLRKYNLLQASVAYDNADAVCELLANGADMNYHGGGVGYAPYLAITRVFPHILELLLPHVDFGILTIYDRSLLYEMMHGVNRRNPGACCSVTPSATQTDLMRSAFRMQRMFFAHLYRRFPNPAELLAYIDQPADGGIVALDALLGSEDASYRRVRDGHMRVLPMHGQWIKWNVLLLCFREHTLRRIGMQPSALVPLTAGEANLFSTSLEIAASAAGIHFDHVYQRNLPHGWSRQPWLHVDVDRWLDASDALPE